MAEAVVGVLIGKIGMALAKEAAAYGASLLGKEASAIKDLFGNIRKAERELDSMKAYLHESEKFKDTDETTSIFVKNIRELSFQVEDVVDEFMYKLEGDKHGGFAAKMKKRIKHVKGEDLVGIEGNAAKLKGCLVDDLEESNTKITTVWGMGGVGKTTLVDHVYKLVKLDFDAAAWVTVSKSYQVEDLLKKIATEFGISVASNMEMIRVVDVIRNHLGTVLKMLPNEVFSLFNLRFLGLRDTQIESLPAAIGRLQNLEVLDASCSSLVSLPKDVVKLKKLRYLYACLKFTNGDFFHFGGVKMPRGMRNLTGLHALQSVKASTETLYDVAALTELRTFAVEDVKSEHTLSLRSALLNMTNLVSLSITTSNENEVLPLEELRLPVSLSKLALIGQLEKKRMPHILSSRFHLDNLTRLCLIFSKLDENTFPNLMVLHNLYFLALHKAYDGKTLCFSKHSFPRLRELCISSAPQLNQVEIEEDALVSLVTLWISGCPELKRLPRGIQYLAAQEELYLENTTDEFIEMLRQESEANDCKEELMKISHIREVIVESTEKNFWRRIVSNKGK
ncbi:unnamed protein product [Urochloa decumbens]|uniref:Uncharacterized protein n=1 Tax=Urochloa decumbens TaxID=240449 RepID=A0ABC9ARH1_9POAL